MYSAMNTETSSTAPAIKPTHHSSPEGRISSSTPTMKAVRNSLPLLCSRSASAIFAASTAMSEVATSGAAMWRSEMPVRSRIHWLLVATIFSRSKLVSTRGGT